MSAHSLSLVICNHCSLGWERRLVGRLKGKYTQNENFTIDLSLPTLKFAKNPTSIFPSFLLAVTAPDVTADLRLRNDL